MSCGKGRFVIISFHPHIKGDINLRLTPNSLFSEQQAGAIASATAIVFTQHVKAHQYGFCEARCHNLFPDYAHRFAFEGKYGNIVLFRKFKAPHPETVCYESVEDFRLRHLERREPLMPFPFVLKGDRGGGGWAVFLVNDQHELAQRLAVLGDMRLHPTRRFIAQAFVPQGGKDLRIVVIGEKTEAYWRRQPNPNEFRNNVGRGAVIDHEASPYLMQKGIHCVRHFCSRTGINLAAFDVLFDRSRSEPVPLLSEINFLFGRKGLGGSPRFHRLLNEAVKGWLEKLPDIG